MEYYTVVGDSYEEAVRKAREMYGSSIRIHSRRDYTTGGGLFSRKRKRCEIVCYKGREERKEEKTGEKDISEFAKEAWTPDPSTLSPSERLDTEIYREKEENQEAVRLLELNHITGKLRNDLLDNLPDNESVPIALSSRLLSLIDFSYDKILHPRHFVVIIGPTGSGKTTTLAKAAYLFSQSGKSVGIITLDTYRTGAFEQMSAFGNALSIPVISAGAEDELLTAVERFSWKDMIFIDTMGLSPRDKELNLKLRGMLSLLDNDRTDYVLTVSASMKEEDIMDQYSSYASFSPSSLAVTKLDETETIGNVLSFSYSVGVPIVFFADGQKVPDDIKKASGEVLLDNLKGFGLDMKRSKAQLSFGR